MNKKEAIEKINELKELSRGTIGGSLIGVGMDKALAVVKQLDEPDKTVYSYYHPEEIIKQTEIKELELEIEELRTEVAKLKECLVALKRAVIGW